jgi:hypothetical protein
MKKIFKRLVVLVTLVLGIGVSAFAGTYKNYEETCKNIWWEVGNIYHADMSAYRACQWEVTDDLWGGFGRQQETIMKNFIQTSPNFNGVVTQPTLVNGTDKTMWCFHYKNGKHYKTTVWTFYIPEETK